MTATPDTSVAATPVPDTHAVGTEEDVAVPTPRRPDEGESWLARLGWEETG